MPLKLFNLFIECYIYCCSCCLLAVLVIEFDYFVRLVSMNRTITLITIHIQLPIRRDFTLAYNVFCHLSIILYKYLFCISLDPILITFQVVLFKETPRLTDQQTDDKLIMAILKQITSAQSKKRNPFLP